MELELLLALFLVAVSTAMAGASIAALLSTARREWSGEWDGHIITLRNYISREQLIVDGRLVAQHSAALAHLSLGATLRAELPSDDGPVPVLASLHTNAFGLHDAEIFVSGLRIPLTKSAIDPKVPAIAA